MEQVIKTYGEIDQRIKSQLVVSACHLSEDFKTQTLMKCRFEGRFIPPATSSKSVEFQCILGPSLIFP